MTDSKRSANSFLRSKLRGIKPAIIELILLRSNTTHGLMTRLSSFRHTVADRALDANATTVKPTSVTLHDKPLPNHFHNVSSNTPPIIIAAARTILNVTRSTSRRKSAAKIREKNGPVLLIGMTTETLPRSSA